MFIVLLAESNRSSRNRSKSPTCSASLDTISSRSRQRCHRSTRRLGHLEPPMGHIEDTMGCGETQLLEVVQQPALTEASQLQLVMTCLTMFPQMTPSSDAVGSLPARHAAETRSGTLTFLLSRIAKASCLKLVLLIVFVA